MGRITSSTTLMTDKHSRFPLMPASDVDLITAVAKDRSQDALETLYDRYRPVLRSVIHRVLYADSDVDDVLQQVLIQIWHQAEMYSPEKGHLLSWLVTLARRRSLDHIRRLCAYKNATDRYETACGPSKQIFTEMFSVNREVCQNELQQQVKVLMHRLPEAQRQAIGLTFFQGLTQREIATRLSVPLGTIKTRIELGMHKLGRSLASEHVA
jgi:RNA polymerase sigma-70 factor (ECF subfamily)